MGGDLETTNRHLLYKPSSPHKIRYCGVIKGNDSIVFIIGKKDKTGLWLTLNKVCKAEDTAFHFLRDLIGFPSV